ncbi:MAG: hypothetical protein KOO60_03120 [Gemmatimonadales bacterium]|nr:hypothetical protein [Gemmatimonadales bacterium]
MAGDGVSLPTTIAQMGSVAKTQAKVQQPAQQGAPFAEQLEKNDELKVQRVKETQEAEQQKIKADEDRKDRRQQRKRKRNQKRIDRLQKENAGSETTEQPELSKEEQEKLGALIDLRV